MTNRFKDALNLAKQGVLSRQYFNVYEEALNIAMLSAAPTPAPTDIIQDMRDFREKAELIQMVNKLVADNNRLLNKKSSTPAPTEKVDYKQLKQLVFMWAADVNGAPLDSDICEIINIIRRTEKVEGIDGLFDAVSVEDLPPPNTDEECDNITKRYQSHEAIYGCAVSETLLEAARAYLKLQTQED